MTWIQNFFRTSTLENMVCWGVNSPGPTPSYTSDTVYHCSRRRRRAYTIHITCSSPLHQIWIFHSKGGKSATKIKCFNWIEKPTWNKTFLELHHWKTWYGILLIYPSFYITTSAAAVAHIHIACSRPLLHQSWSWCFHAKGGKWPWSHLKARTSRLYF